MKRGSLFLLVLIAICAFVSRTGSSGASLQRNTTRPIRCVKGTSYRITRIGPSRDVITVAAQSERSTTAVVELWQRRAGCFTDVLGPYPAHLGYAGLSIDRVEGDGTTPVGEFGIGSTVYGIDPTADTGLAYHHLVCGDWWDEDPSSSLYNRFVHVACGIEPSFGPQSEALWTEAPAYEHFAVILFNTDPVVPGRGSGIFLHDDIGVPTDGCVSIPARDLNLVLARLRPADHPVIAIGTAAQLRAL